MLVKRKRLKVQENELYQEYLPDFSTEEKVKKKFENSINDFFECKHSIGVTTGTSAIEVALKSLNLPLGSHVALPEISFIATATAVANCGMIPVYIDIDESHFGLSYDSLNDNFNSDIKCVIVVHFAGYVDRDILRIKEFCQKENVCLIEDCSQAIGSEVNGQKVGTIGDVGTYSFQTSKLINSGEGGLIITNNSKIFYECEKLVNWGYNSSSDRDLSVPSSNYRLSAIQCYFIIKQIDKFYKIHEERIKLNKLVEERTKVLGVEHAMPENVNGIVDSPFFFPVKSTEKLNTIEPRPEYPMHKSNIVLSILKRFFPTLVTKYEEVNVHAKNNDNANRMLNTIDFLNFRDDFCSDENCVKKSIDNALSQYTYEKMPELI